MDAMENKVITFDQEEVTTGLKAVLEWLKKTYREGVEVVRAHKKALLISVAVIVGVAGIVGGLIALLGRKK